ncbi:MULTISPECIES: tail fiber assembly protein [Paraburkholderia]
MPQQAGFPMNIEWPDLPGDTDAQDTLCIL